MNHLQRLTEEKFNAMWFSDMALSEIVYDYKAQLCTV